MSIRTLSSSPFFSRVVLFEHGPPLSQWLIWKLPAPLEWFHFPRPSGSFRLLVGGAVYWRADPNRPCESRLRPGPLEAFALDRGPKSRTKLRIGISFGGVLCGFSPGKMALCEGTMETWRWVPCSSGGSWRNDFSVPTGKGHV